MVGGLCRGEMEGVGVGKEDYVKQIFWSGERGESVETQFGNGDRGIGIGLAVLASQKELRKSRDKSRACPVA